MALRKPKKIIQPNWHPNFRNVETLPDIKVIRTDFFINFSTVAIAAALLFYLLFNEYTGHALNRQINELSSEISAREASNTKNIALSKEFDTLSKGISELNAFLEAPVVPGEFIVTFSDLMPREILLESLSYSSNNIPVGKKSVPGKTINIRGSVSGSPGEATQIVNDFIDTLEELPMFEGILNKIELLSLNRDDARGLFDCAIRIELIPQTGKKKK